MKFTRNDCYAMKEFTLLFIGHKMKHSFLSEVLGVKQHIEKHKETKRGRRLREI